MICLRRSYAAIKFDGFEFINIDDCSGKVEIEKGKK